MRQLQFEETHAKEWEEFEKYLDDPKGGKKKTPPFDPAEMPVRYRRICQHLALAADRQYSPGLVDRLNSLALRGHHALYRNRRRQSQRLLEFALAGFPRLVRQEWRLATVATLLFFGPLLALIAVLQVFPEFVHYLLAPEQIASFHRMYDPANPRLGAPREADSNLLMFGFYIWNNVRIGFQTFAGGLLAGVGSIWFLGANGVIIGAVAGYLTQVGFSQTFWSFVAGHSSLELTAIVLAGTAGLKLGMAVIAPGNLSRRAALVEAARPAVRIMYGAALMFVAAAFVEAFWSPLTIIPFGVKIGAGIAGWVVILAYLFLGDARLQPADIAVTLRRRSPWEAMDLGLAMLQRWWRQCYAPQLLIGVLVAAGAWGLATWLARPWVAILLVWWMKPLYDRVVLHVLSRAVFGELQSTREVLTRRSGEWLGAGLVPYLLFRWWPDMARSFNLPVRQLEGQTGAAGRERRTVLGRRASSYAVWLTVVCLHFEVVLYWSLQRMAQIFLPAKAFEGRALTDIFVTGELFSQTDLLAYTAAVLLLEPFYVAAGFALYLNRRTLLEGWDVEVALRRIAESRAKAPAAVAVAAMLAACVALVVVAPPASAADRDPRREIAEVLKAPEFPHQVDTLRWERRDPGEPEPAGKSRPRDNSGSGFNIGQGLAEVARVLFWVAAIGALGYALWWMARLLPQASGAGPEPYRPPASLFGMELAPDKLPADVAGAALDLARAGRLREALSLLYRGTLSHLVHRRGVELLSSHTEAEVLALAREALPTQGGWYLDNLVTAWRLSAYARRDPSASEVERLATDYRGVTT